jgi:hypothetical protein
MVSVEQKRKLKEKAIRELKKFAEIVGYLWVVISMFDIHKLIVFRTQHLNLPIGFKLGLNLVNALVLGKIVLIGDSLHLGEQFKDKALIYPILFKSAVFALLLVCFDILEEVVIGMLHGKTMARSVPQLGGGGFEGNVLVGVMIFIALVPLFAFMEVRRVLGDAHVHSLLFDDRTKAAAQLGTHDQIQNTSTIQRRRTG